MVEYYEYGKHLFWKENEGMGYERSEAEKFAYMIAIDMYSRQVDLEPLKKELNDPFLK